MLTRPCRIDVNKIKMYQQFVIYVLPLLTNPITINAGVVYVRLHWFEKRFKHIGRFTFRHCSSMS